jgi:hypothetical protein
MLPKDPLRAIFPIIKSYKDNAYSPLYSFIGTGFFISGNGEFLTAKHVFESNPLSEGQHYKIINISGGIKPFPVSEITLSEKYDIAIGKLKDMPESICPLEISNENQPMNLDILTVEFSATRSKKMENGQIALELRPSFRKGNVISYYQSDFPEALQTWSLELSFPALKGASGAPVVIERNGLVVGMIVQNIEKELLPAHTEKIVSEYNGNIKEEVETKYFMPNGKAISWYHLIDFIKIRQ